MSTANASEGIRPTYYSPENPYEPVKVIFAWDVGFALGNVLKYIYRAHNGGKASSSPLEDLRKARTYLDLQIAELEKQELP